jgi:hypothetical protein
MMILVRRLSRANVLLSQYSAQGPFGTAQTFTNFQSDKCAIEPRNNICPLKIPAPLGTPTLGTILHKRSKCRSLKPEMGGLPE